MEKLMKKYIQRLNAYGTFDKEVSGEQYFSFVDTASEEFRKLRLEFDLERFIRGTALQQALSLMDWVHKELFCVGEQVTPASFKTGDIMAVRKTGALYCWYHAVAMAEMLLSIGIPARVVSCLPESFDHDCHMAVLVYDNDAGRWFFADATFNTYFYSEDGRAQDIFEIRESYRAGNMPRFRHITIDKQWELVCNGVFCRTYDEWYTLYKAKNTFRFMSPAETSYGCLSHESLPWIGISPLGYRQKNEYNEGKNITVIHNPIAFLQRP